MADNKIGVLVPISISAGDFTSCQRSIDLDQKMINLGRDNLVDKDNKKVSRFHLQLQVDSEGTVKMTATGQNPVVRIPADSLEPRQILNPGDSCTLKHCDIVEWLPGKLPFRFLSAATGAGRKLEEVLSVSSNRRSRTEEQANRNHNGNEVSEVLPTGEAATASAGESSPQVILDLVKSQTELLRGGQVEAMQVLSTQSLKGTRAQASEGLVLAHSELQTAVQCCQGALESELKRGLKRKEFEVDVELVEDLSLASQVSAQALRVAEFAERARQMAEDEALARLLQEEETALAQGGIQESNEGCHEMAGPSDSAPGGSQLGGCSQMQGLHDLVRIEENEANKSGAATFRLLKTVGVPPWANQHSVSINDVIKGDVQWAILSDYMVDLPWLLSACPLLAQISKVVLIHGERGPALHNLQRQKPATWELYAPPLRVPWGTHHSKAMLLGYPLGIRVVIHTANLLHIDFHNKTQGLWMQDFPLKAATSGASEFENDLVEYVNALEWRGCPVPGDSASLLDAQYLRQYDFSAAAVRLVGSVPGYHTGEAMKRWGHVKLRTLLQGETTFSPEFVGSPLVFQFSSLGAIDERWIAELAASLSAGSAATGRPLGSPDKISFVWPTVEDVQSSLEGYAAGASVCGPQKNVAKAAGSRSRWARWDARRSGRQRAMPHIKTFLRHQGKEIAWLLLTSSNLSKAAWGALQKENSQLMIRSYELGVLFIPSLLAKYDYCAQFSCTPHLAIPRQLLEASTDSDKNGDERCLGQRTVRLVAGEWAKDARKELREGSQSEDGKCRISFPVPYLLPPPDYESRDTPWIWDVEYGKPDVFGHLWPRSFSKHSATAMN